MRKQNKIFLAIIVGIFILSGFMNSFSQLIGSSLTPEPGDEPRRVILISLDSCNPEYISPEYMPNLYQMIIEGGCKFQNAKTILSSNTVAGHTSMLTGAYVNTTGICGNGVRVNATHFNFFGQDPSYRNATTLFESIAESPLNATIDTFYICGKPITGILSTQADFILSAKIQLALHNMQGQFSILTGGNALYIHWEWDINNIDLFAKDVGTAFGELEPCDSWVINGLVQALKKEAPLASGKQYFYFVNTAQVDDVGHTAGAFNPNMNRHLREMDALLTRVCWTLKSLGKYNSTLFVITSDHGMSTIESTFNIERALNEFGFYHNINCFIQYEGNGVFLHLYNSAYTDALVANLTQKNNEVNVMDLILPKSQYADYHLDNAANRTGDIFLSAKQGVSFVTNGIAAFQAGNHGGLNDQDVPLAFFGPRINKTRLIFNAESVSIVDIVPTICSITGWPLPPEADGRILSEIIIP
ncbi:MAG TPA: alkaline phosphatase family protein [Candidatus Deferrimicrobium sp.]|nr:alkaline phosphatase family protein [Candidatus Deferrimicrobium sp.]